jgi:hypothetical protein
LLGACSDAQAPIVIALPEIAAADSAEPNLSRAADGTVILSWLEPLGHGVALRYSVLDENDWSAPITVASGDDWFVNWADFPSVVKVDGDLWTAHWLAKRPGGTYAYDVAISLSSDGGRTWGESITPHTDNTLTEHGFVSLFSWQDGVGALWLDGRNMSGHDEGGMTLRSAVIDSQGELAYEQLADELVCDCCQTDVTVAPEGPVAVYRNRTEEEIRDIYVMRAIDGRWQPGKPVGEDGWKIAGCPVNGPAITSNGEDVAVAWFTAAGNTPKVRFARSVDGGESFENAIDVATARPAGRVGVALADDGSATVSWLRVGADGKGEIVIRNVSHDGELGEDRLIATTDAGRMSGFPQLVRDNDNLVLAWTDTLGKITQVRSALLKTSP